MFYSQCLLSRKGPLGAVWVAAYSFKKLKKAQVNQTDISSSVDKILQDDWDAIAYRVLAYLLLGVVRIYSKKVEYLFDDCHEVLIKINKFVVSTKGNVDAEQLRASYYAVTLPDTFELDAFDLGILEDDSGCNVVSHEDITLKDCAKGHGIGQFYLQMYDCEEFDACDNIASADYTPVKDVFSPYLLDFDMELRTSSCGANSEALKGKLQEDGFSQEECAGVENICRAEEPPNQVKPRGEDHETTEEIEAQDIALSENGVQGEANTEQLRELRLSQKVLNLETFYGTERESSCHVRSSSDDRQIDKAEIMETELVQPESPTLPITSQDHDLITLEVDIEKMRSFTISQEEYMDLDMFCGMKQPQELACSFGVENDNDGEPKKLPNGIEGEVIVQEDPDSLSVAYDGTPGAKLPHALDDATPKFVLIPTPATKESLQISTPATKESSRIAASAIKESPRISTPAAKYSTRISTTSKKQSARISRKRKCVIDDMTVLPNELVRQSIQDASDLVSKRRKVPQTSLAAWKAFQFGNLNDDILEPLIPAFVFQELRSLFCKRKLKIIEPSETVGTPEKLDVPESPNLGRSEQIEIAPETPVLRSKSVKSFESPKSPGTPEMDIIRPESSRRIEKEPLLGREQAEPSGTPEMDIIRPEPSGRIEKEPLLGREQAEPSGSATTAEEAPILERGQDHDFNFLNEDIDSSEGVNHQLDGLSTRTRMVARYLQTYFPNCSNRGAEEVRLFQVSEGRSKKESARLFYEILVLKSKGYVDVKQEDPYGDILIRKLLKSDQTWGDDTVNRSTYKTKAPPKLCTYARRIRSLV